MLFLLSPAKSLDFDTPPHVATHTPPLFVRQSTELIKVLREKTPAQVSELMSLSDTLAGLNVARYQVWSPKFSVKNAKQAVLAFNGDVYEGLDAKSLPAADLDWAQAHLCILSGLHGVLRPLDLMQPYRLEMGTRLATPAGASLYDYWGDRLALHLNKLAKGEKAPVIVNLASQEYFRAADRKALKPRVVDCQFEDWKNGEYKIISFFAKRARGLMARYAIQNRIETPEGLKGFDIDGYGLASEASTPDRLVFRRKS